MTSNGPLQDLENPLTSSHPSRSSNIHGSLNSQTVNKGFQSSVSRQTIQSSLKKASIPKPNIPCDNNELLLIHEADRDSAEEEDKEDESTVDNFSTQSVSSETTDIGINNNNFSNNHLLLLQYCQKQHIKAGCAWNTPS